MNQILRSRVEAGRHFFEPHIRSHDFPDLLLSPGIPDRSSCREAHHPGEAVLGRRPRVAGDLLPRPGPPENVAAAREEVVSGAQQWHRLRVPKLQGTEVAETANIDGAIRTVADGMGRVAAKVEKMTVDRLVRSALVVDDPAG